MARTERPGEAIVRASIEELERILHYGAWPSGREVERWERRQIERTIRDMRRARRERST